MFVVDLHPLMVVIIAVWLGCFAVWSIKNMVDLRNERRLRKGLEAEVKKLGVDLHTNTLRKETFYRDGNHLLARAKRLQEKTGCDPILYGVLYNDLDGVKRVNDEGSHDLGDEFLVAFAESVKKHIRPTDLFGRLGGDEFAVMFLDLNENKRGELTHRRLEEIVEKIRKDLAADSRFTEYNVGVSVGIFIGEVDKFGLDDAITIADAGQRKDKADRGVVRGSEKKKN